MKNLILLLLPFIMDLVEAKYCAFEVTGETRFYTCPRTEYCCNFGCCVSPAFQFYQLWYYWLLVIFMFLLCSGGGWWYRCWLRGRFPETQTSLTRHTTLPPGRNTRRSTLIRSNGPAPPPASILPPPLPEGASTTTATPQSQFQVARVSYSTSGDRLILHRLWKDARGGLHHLDSPPSYSTARADTQPTPLGLASAATTVLVDPYILYGPPPSYESVIQEDQAGPSGSQGDAPQLEVSSPSPVEEASSSGSSQPSPMTPPSPTSPQEISSAASPTSPMADVTSDEDRGPPTSHQASQTVSSPILSPTNPAPL